LKILILDNYDSFTYNLYHYVNQFCSNVSVIKNDEIELSSLKNYDKIILSPGPGLPNDHKNLMEVISVCNLNKPILGVCLGHQAIASFFGADIINLNNVMHGVAANIEIIENDYIFKSLPKNLKVGLYHSWVVGQENFPNSLTVTSKSEFGYITSFKHKSLDLRGIQFHPESILTKDGLEIIKNWVEF
jgi:anthranilate synthase component 2